MSRCPVGILGAAGVAGRQALVALAEHPWFEVVSVAGSAANAGRRLGDVIDARAADERDVARRLGAPAAADAPGAGAAPPLPAALRDLVLADAATVDVTGLDAVFSMLPTAPARELEARCAGTTPVISTAAAWRMDRDTPLLMAGVNPDHAALLGSQQRAHGWRGWIAPNPNCTTVGLVVPLAPMARAFGLRGVTLTSLQAVSGAGAGAPEVAERVAGNVLPFIAGEEEKVSAETRRILGTLAGTAIEPLDVPVGATCTRVPVADGHLISVSVAFEQAVAPGDVAALLRDEDPWQGRELPSRPERWIEVRAEDDRPQPTLDRDTGGGLTTVVGRLRADPVSGGVSFMVLSHNTVLGAAGGAVLLAEDLADRGLLPTR
ncbi:MAG: aspartate-semialdehyde dehydrogenase [Planctomycetota bacterium]